MDTNFPLISEDAMDPDATFRQIMSHLKSGEFEEASELAGHLELWFAGNGFHPDSLGQLGWTPMSTSIAFFYLKSLLQLMHELAS